MRAFIQTALVIGAMGSCYAKHVTVREGEEVDIKTNEVATVLSFYDATAGFNGQNPYGIGVLQIQKGKNALNSNTNLLDVQSYHFIPQQPTSRGQLVLAGPAIIRVLPQGLPALVTVKIEPESFPPDKTVIIPQGSTATVNLECSTNLLDWTSVWSGSYSNVPTHKFFRLSATRHP